MKAEKQKMLAGGLYNALDSQFVEERRQAKELLRTFNDTFAGDENQRVLIARHLFAECGVDAWIKPTFYCDYGSNITMGDYVYFNFNCVILDPAPVKIGSIVMFGPLVQIYTATHPVPYLDRRKGPEYTLGIEIGSDVWAGGGAVVNPGVKIGARSVIGAGSVVTKNIPADDLQLAIPAR